MILPITASSWLPSFRCGGGASVSRLTMDNPVVSNAEMRILTFTDAELAQISAESPTFAAKLTGDKKFQPAPPESFTHKNPIATQHEQEARAYLETIRGTNSPARCVDLIRTWAKAHGYSGFATQAGAKRLVSSQGRAI